MSSIPIEQAQVNLVDLINGLEPGQEIIITQNDKPVARLVGEEAEAKVPRKLGTMAGTVIYMAPDFDAPLEDFKEYM